MLLWAYFAAVTTDPGRVPPGWHPFQDEQVRCSSFGLAHADGIAQTDITAHVKPSMPLIIHCWLDDLRHCMSTFQVHASCRLCCASPYHFSDAVQAAPQSAGSQHHSNFDSCHQATCSTCKPVLPHQLAEPHPPPNLPSPMSSPLCPPNHSTSTLIHKHIRTPSLPASPLQQARAELERMAYSDYYFDRRDPRRPRYCKRCQAWKPERAHHCSVSGHCVLKMDHYCIWVVNCVGLLNYKHFLLFLFYTFLASLTSLLLLLKPMIEFFTAEDRGG
jgi:hypothetical protein